MKPIPLEVLARELGQAREQLLTTSSKESSETTNPPANHIVDIADQYVGKILIITSSMPRKREESLSNGIRSAMEKPPEK